MTNLHGWLILDKPLGITSAHAVAKVKRLLKPSKIGHAGTLDPLATGILPLALGEATKTVHYAMDGCKAYRFTVTWGEERDTGDAEGQVTETSPNRPTREQILAVLPSFTGIIEQIPPAYSAIKIGGERAYALARAGETVEMPSREVEIIELNLLECQQDSATFLTECGKGTYVRSLATDIARALGTLGYVSALRRLAVNPFDESHAISLENLEEMVHNGGLARIVHPVDFPLDDILAREIPPGLAGRLQRGQPIVLLGEKLPNGTLIRAKANGKLVALCEALAGTLKPVRVFNL